MSGARAAIGSGGMVSKILVIFLGGYWFISAGVAAWIGRQKGRMIEGLGLGILMGPIGPILVALLPELRKAAAPMAHPDRQASEPHSHDGGEHEGDHGEHALPVAEVDHEAHDHVHRKGDEVYGGHGERTMPARALAYGAEADFAGEEDEEARAKKRIRIDWLWLIFYGGWSLFVVFCWLWLLVYV